MASKLGLHFQNIPDWARQPGYVSAPYVKLIDPPSDNPFPHARVIARAYMPDGEANAYVAMGASGARPYFDALLPKYRNAPYAYAWCGPNEPPVATPQQRRALCDFTAAWAELMHTVLRKPVIGLNISVGWPDVGTAAELRSAILACDGWALHEYDYPTLFSSNTWRTLRYRRTVAELGGSPRPLFILELGIDRAAVVDAPHAGYRTVMGEEDYMAQLAAYDAEIQKDPYVVCATPFVSGANGDWDTFDVNERLWQLMSEHIRNSGSAVTGPAPLPPPNSITEDALREAAWRQLGVPYTPNYALAKYASGHNLGAPLSPEYRLGNMVCQLFANAILYVPEGRWHEIKELRY